MTRVALRALQAGFALALTAAAAAAQSAVFSGKVTSAGQPLGGASVGIVELGVGATTAVDALSRDSIVFRADDDVMLPGTSVSDAPLTLKSSVCAEKVIVLPVLVTSAPAKNVNEFAPAVEPNTVRLKLVVVLMR